MKQHGGSPSIPLRCSLGRADFRNDFAHRYIPRGRNQLHTIFERLAECPATTDEMADSLMAMAVNLAAVGPWSEWDESMREGEPFAFVP